MKKALLLLLCGLYFAASGLFAQTTLFKDGKEFFNGDDRHLYAYLNNNYHSLDALEGIWMFTRIEYNAWGLEVSRTPNEYKAAIVRDKGNPRRAFVEVNFNRAFCKPYQIAYNIQQSGGSGVYPLEPVGCSSAAGHYTYNTLYNTISRPGLSLTGNNAVLVGIRIFPQGPPTEMMRVEETPASTERNQVQAREPHIVTHPSGWEPHIDWDNQIFSSYILSVNTTYSKPIYNAPDYRGDANSVVGIVVENPRYNSEIEIEIEPTRYSKGVKETFRLEKKGRQYGVFPTIPWDQQLLMCMVENNKVYFTFKVRINGKETPNQTVEVTMRPIDDCPLFAYDYNGYEVNLRYLFTAYVNEGSAIVENLTKEIKDKGLLREFVGSSHGPSGAIGQVYAFWKVLKDRNITYSTISNNGYKAKKVFSQRVRLLEDVMDKSLANCIDGTVLLASCIMPSGIPATIVIIPGHAFLGYKVDVSEDKKVKKWVTLYLETTMLGGSAANLPAYYDELIKTQHYSGIKNILYQKFNNGKTTKNQEIDHFILAMMRGELEYKEAKTETPDGVMEIDIEEYRTRVTPIHRCNTKNLPKVAGGNIGMPLEQNQGRKGSSYGTQETPDTFIPAAPAKLKRKGTESYDNFEFLTDAPARQGEYFKVQIELTLSPEKAKYQSLAQYCRLDTEWLLPDAKKARVLLGDFDTYEKAIPTAKKVQAAGHNNVTVVRYKDGNRLDSRYRDWGKL